MVLFIDVLLYKVIRSYIEVKIDVDVRLCKDVVVYIQMVLSIQMKDYV